MIFSPYILILVAWVTAFLPWAVACAALPIAEASLIKVVFHDNANGTSWLSGSVIACESGQVVVVTNSHGTRDGVRAIEIIAPGIGAATAQMLLCGDPDDKTQDLCVVIANLGVDLPVIPLARVPAQIGDSVFAAGFPNNAPRASPHAGQVISQSPEGNLVVGFAVQGGESGSPIVNANGELVAINWGSSGGQSWVVNYVHLMRLLETQCSGPSCQVGPVRNLLGRCGEIMYGQPQQPQMQQQVTQPIFRQDQQPMQSPSLTGPVIRPITQPSPFATQQTAPPTIEYSKIVDELKGDTDFLGRLAVDDRFRGPPGRDGKDGKDGMTPLVDYTKIQSGLAEMIPEVIAKSTPISATPPFDLVATITTIAAALGLNIAIPGGALGIIGVKLIGAFLRHRLAMRQAQRHTPPTAAGVGQDPFDARRGHVSAETKPVSESRSTTIRMEPPTNEIETRTEIVQVPTVNREAEALHEALTRELKTFPKHAPIVTRVRSVAEQLLQGRRVTDSGRTGNTQGSRVGWSDT